MERFRLNSPYRMRLNSLSTPLIQQSRLDPNTQMRVLTDPLLNISYRRQFEDYEQNLFTEAIGRVEGAAIGAGLGYAAGTIIGSVVSLLVPGDFGAIAVAGAVIGGAAGGASADYTTFHAVNDMFSTVIIDSFKQNPAMGVLNTLAFTGKSMDLLMGGEFIRSTISAAITGNDVFENVARAYGAHEDGRTEYDFSVLREQMGIDLGSFGNTVFDMTGEILTDPGSWGGITGKLLTRGKAGKAIAESLDEVNSSMKVITKQAMKDPKLMKQLARSFRHGNKDEILSVMKNMVDKRKTKAINEEVLSKFISNVQDSAIKNTGYRAYKMFSQIDEADDFLTANIFRLSNPPIAAWHGLKKSANFINEKWLYNLAPDSKAAEAISKSMDFIFGNRSKVNFIKEGVVSARKYISDKYNESKALYKEGTFEYFLENVLDPTESAYYKDLVKKGNTDINSPIFNNIREAYVKHKDEVLAKLKQQTNQNAKRVLEINSEVNKLDKQLEKIMGDKKHRVQLDDELRQEYKKLYDKRKQLEQEFRNIAKQENDVIWQTRVINRTPKDKEFNKILRELKKLASLTRGQMPGEEKQAVKLIKRLVKLINESDGEQYLDEIMFAYRNQPTLLDFLKKNIDDEIIKELKETYSDKSSKYINDLVKSSPKYRQRILLEEIQNLNRLKTDANESKFNILKEQLGELTTTALKENPTLETFELYKDKEFFSKAMGLINDFKNKYLFDSLKDDEFILKTDIVKQTEIDLKKQVKEINKIAKFNNILSSSRLSEFSEFGYYISKTRNSNDILTEQFRETFNDVVQKLNELSTISKDTSLKEAVNLINTVVGSYVKVDSGISQTYRNLKTIKKRLSNIKPDTLLNKVRRKLNLSYQNVSFQKIPNEIYFNEANINKLISEFENFKRFDKYKEADYNSMIEELKEIKLSREVFEGEAILDYIDPIVFRDLRFTTLDDIKQYALHTVRSRYHPLIISNLDEAERIINFSYNLSKQNITDDKLKTEFIKFLDEFKKFINDTKRSTYEKWSGKKIYSFMDTINEQLEKFQVLQTKFAVSSMKFEFHFIKKTYEELIDNVLVSSMKIKKQCLQKLTPFLMGKGLSLDDISSLEIQYEGEQFIEKISELTEVPVDRLVEIIPDFSKYRDAYNNYDDYKHMLGIMGSCEVSLDKLSVLISDLKGVTENQLAWGVLDDIVYSSNSSIKNIIDNLNSPMFDLETVLSETFNLMSRNKIILDIFNGTDDIMLNSVIKRVGEIEQLLDNLLNSKISRDEFKLSAEEKMNLIQSVRNFAYKDKLIRNKFGFEFKIKTKDGKFYYDTSKYSSNFKVFIDDLTKKIDSRDIKLHELLNYNINFVKEIIEENKKIDPENISILSKLFDNGSDELNKGLINSLFTEDYTKNLTLNHILKHIRSNNKSKKDFFKKNVKNFKYVVVDTETMNLYQGLLSISYREFFYDNTGKLIKGKEKVMYLNPSEIRKDWVEDVETDSLNEDILKSLGIKRDFSKGATRQLHEYNVGRVGKSYSMKEMLDELNTIANNDDTFLVMHNASFDIKQILNAKYELDHPNKHLFNDEDSFNINNDFNFMFTQSKYDWNVLDTLDLVDKYGLVNTNELTNLDIGKSNLGFIKEYWSNGVLKKTETIGDINNKYVIKEIFDTSKDEPIVTFNGQPLHFAEVDTELTQAWLDGIFSKLGNVSIGEFNGSIYTDNKYIDDLINSKRKFKYKEFSNHFKRTFRDYKNRNIIPYRELSKQDQRKIDFMLADLGISVDVDNLTKEDIKELPNELQDIFGFPEETMYHGLDEIIQEKEITFKEYFKSVIDKYNNLSRKGLFTLSDSSDYNEHLSDIFNQILNDVSYDNWVDKEVNDNIRKMIPFLEELLDRYKKKIISEDPSNLYSEQSKYIEKITIPKELESLQELIDEYNFLLQEASAQKNINFAMTKQKNIAYRQQNTAEVNMQLTNSFKYNEPYKILRDIFRGKSTDDATSTVKKLAKLFNSNSNDPAIKKLNSLPQIQKLKETINDMEDNIQWFEELSNDISELSPNYSAHYSVVCQILNEIDRIIKEKVSGFGLNVELWKPTDIEEVLGIIRAKMTKLQYMYRGSTDLTFGNVQVIYDRIVDRCEEMLSKGKLPYLQPSSKFTNDFYNQLNEFFLTPLKDSDGIFKNASGEIEYTDDVITLQNLMSDAVRPIRLILAEVKSTNKLYRANPINIRNISNKMVMDLGGGDNKIQKALRPIELPLYSNTTLVYSKPTKGSINDRRITNEIFSSLYKDLEIFDERTMPITNFESNKLSQMVSKIAEAVGFTDEYILNNMRYANIDTDEPLSELKKAMLECLYNGNFNLLFSSDLIKALGPDKLSKLQALAAEILFINQDTFKAIKPEKVEQLKNILASAIFDNLIFSRNNRIRNKAQFAYNEALTEVDATKHIWQQIQKFYTKADGTVNIKGISKYFATNKHEALVYIDPTTGYLRKLNTDNINLLKTIFEKKDTIDVSVMSEDSYLKYASQHQRREIKSPVFKFMRDAILRNIKIASLTFSLPFVVTNALAAAIQDITSSEGTINVVSFTKNFTKAMNEYKMWKEPYEVIGSSYVSYYYRETHKGEVIDWADYFGSKDFRNYIESLIKDTSSYSDILSNKSASAIKSEAEAVLKLLNQYKDTDIIKIKQFNEYMRTASVSGQSAEFNNRERIYDAQQKNLEYYKKLYEENAEDMRYFIYNNKPNTADAIKQMGFDGKVPKFKSIKDEYSWLKKQQKLSEDLHYRKNQLENMIDKADKEFYVAWMDKLKLPKMFLDFNGDMEVVFRTTMLKTLIDEGASLDEAAAEVIKRHFLYTDKSVAEQYAEFIIPFISYPLRSLNLFDELIDDSSFMKMAYLWDKYSWGDAEEQRKQSDYLTSRKAKGDIPIGDSLVKGTNPFTESMMLLADPVGSFKNKLNPIIRTATGISPVTQLPGISQANNLVQGLQDMSTGNYTPGQITGLANSFYRNSQYFYSKQPFTTKVKPFYNNLYTSGGFSRIAMNMQPTTLKNVQYRVGNILYKRHIM